MPPVRPVPAVHCLPDLLHELAADTASWLAGWLAGRLAGRLAGWLVYLLAVSSHLLIVAVS